MLELSDGAGAAEAMTAFKFNGAKLLWLNWYIVTDDLICVADFAA